MPPRTAVRSRRPFSAVLLLVVAALAAFAWFRPVTSSAQDSTPMPPPAGSPEAMAMGATDCTQPLGLPAGNACVNVIHASPDAPAVDVAVTGGPVLFENAAFPAGTDYAEVDAGTYDLEIRPTGTTDVALAVPGVAIEEGQVYDIFAIGLVGDGTLAALPLVATAADGILGTPTAGAARRA